MDLGTILRRFHYQPYLLKTQIEYPNVNKDKTLRKKLSFITKIKSQNGLKMTNRGNL